MTGCSTDSQAASRPVPQFDANTKVIALTFDDGPSSTTPLVLDKLDQYRVVASFFVCGNNVGEQTADTVKRACDMGCEIHNHSKSHRDMTKLTEEQIRREITETSQRVEAITGEPTRFFRPPYIAVNDLMYDTVGMPFICGYGSTTGTTRWECRNAPTRCWRRFMTAASSCCTMQRATPKPWRHWIC